MKTKEGRKKKNDSSFFGLSDTHLLCHHDSANTLFGVVRVDFSFGTLFGSLLEARPSLERLLFSTDEKKAFGKSVVVAFIIQWRIKAPSNSPRFATAAKKRLVHLRRPNIVSFPREAPTSSRNTPTAASIAFNDATSEGLRGRCRSERISFSSTPSDGLASSII